MNDTTPAPATFRNKRRARFTQVGNAALMDARLSLGAKGLLTLMLSRPDDWTYHMSWMQKQSTDSLYALRKMLKELEGAGYVVRWAGRGARGRLTGWEYAVSDDPADLTDFTNYRKTVAPSDGGSHATNTDLLTKTDLEKEKDGAKNRAGSEHAPQAPETTPQPPVRKNDQLTRKAAEQSRATALENVPPPLAVPPALAAHTGWEEAWGGWLAYRRTRRLTCAPVTLQAQLKKLAAMPDPLAVVEQSIANGWNGLFELKAAPARRPQTTAEANTRLVERIQTTAEAVRGIFNDD